MPNRETPAYNQISEQYDAGYEQPSVLIKRRDDTVATARLTDRVDQHGRRIAEFMVDGRLAEKPIHAAGLSDEVQARLAAELAGDRDDTAVEHERSTQGRADLGYATVRAALAGLEAPAVGTPEAPEQDTPAAEGRAPEAEVSERAEKRALKDEERQELASKWLAMLDGLDTGRASLEQDFNRLRQAHNDPLFVKELTMSLSRAVPSQSLNALRSDVMRARSDKSEDTWLPAIVHCLTAIGNMPLSLAGNLQHAHSQHGAEAMMHDAIRQAMQYEERLRSLLSA